MDLGIDSKVTLVSGASVGIGLAIARELAREGARTVLVARGEAPPKIAAEAIAAEGGNVHHVCADMGRSEGVAHAVAETTAHLGAPDIAICNTFPR